jgi:hypothetical protein
LRSRERPVRGSDTTDAALRPPRQVRPPPGRRRQATAGAAAGEREERKRRTGDLGRRGGVWRAARSCQRRRPAGVGAGSQAVTDGAARPAGRAGLPPGTAGIHPPLHPLRRVGPAWRGGGLDTRPGATRRFGPVPVRPGGESRAGPAGRTVELGWELERARVACSYFDELPGGVVIAGNVGRVISCSTGREP